MKKIHIPVSVLLACLLLGCATTSILDRGEDSLIRYQQIDKDTGEVTLELVLVRETHKDYTNLYSEKRSEPNIKKVPVPDFTNLLRSLEDRGFVEMSRPLLPGVQPRRKDATKALIVETEGGQWILQNVEMTLDQRKEFGTMIQMFRNCFDSTFQLQLIDNREGRDLFLEEQRKLNEQNRQRSNQ